MKRSAILLPLCMVVAVAHAAERHEWYVLKTSEGAYAFDTDSVETEMGSGTKSVGILIGAHTGNTNVSYDIDCRKSQGQFISSIASDDEKKSEELAFTEGNTKPTDPGWSDIPKSGSMKIAADIACGRPVTGAILVKSEKAALAKLKILSK